MKEMLIKELKKEFLPYNPETFDDTIIKHFRPITERNINESPNGFFAIVSTYGKKMIYVIEKDMLIIFIEGKKDLVILLVTDYGGFYNHINLASVVTRSVTKVDIIASADWLKENKDITDIVNLISNNKSHIGVEYLINGSDSIKDFNFEYMKSPLLWYLLREDLNKTSGYKNSAKTKERFVQGVVKVILNSITKSNSIFNKDMKKIKSAFYTEVVKYLLSDKSRKCFIEDLKSRNGLIFVQSIYSNLFDSLNYDKDEFDRFIDGEFLPYLQEELTDFIFEESVSTNHNDSFVSIIQRSIMDSIGERKFRDKLYSTHLNSLLLKEDRKYYRLVLDELIDLVNIEFDKEILTNSYERRIKDKVEVPFAEDLYSEILNYRLDEIEGNPYAPTSRERNNVLAVAIEDDIPF